MNKGYTLIELVVVIILIGILSAVAVPRFERRIELTELKGEKDFTYNLWEELEVYAKKQYELTGQQSWPEHPLSVLGRTRNIIVQELHPRPLLHEHQQPRLLFLLHILHQPHLVFLPIRYFPTWHPSLIQNQ